VLGLLISDHVVTDQAANLWRYSLKVGVGLAATIAMSAVSYRWLETPFLRLKQRFTHVLSRPGG
jgi:peptidoglycan/LPS O-acetylase OafA/YrhL